MVQLSSPLLKVAVGIAVPAIEAWYLFSRDASLTESTWRTHLGSVPRTQVRRKLKQKVYGTEMPTRPIAKEAATTAATHLVSNLVSFEQHFPNGFGPLAKTLRTWL